MDLEDDLPPDLVATQLDNTAEEKRPKVPITIVTGTDDLISLEMGYVLISIILCRLPRGRKDHITQLHLDSPAWQEDCCNYE